MTRTSDKTKTGTRDDRRLRRLPGRRDRARRPRRAAHAAGARRLRRRRRRLRAPHEGAGPAHGDRPRPAGVRHGRHHEPAADLGHGAGPAGRHVPGRQGRRRARRAARLFPRRRRMPRLQVGVRPRRAGAPDDARHLRRRLHADRQGAEPRARGGGEEARQRAGLRRRLHGGGHRRPVRPRRRAGAAGRAGVPVPGGRRRPRRDRPSARSRASPRAPTAASTPAPPRS